MVTEAEYVTRITVFGYDDLMGLWGQIEVGDTPGWDPGRAFEYLVLRAFQLEGAQVRWPYAVLWAGIQIEQIDGVVYANGLGCLMEMKDQTERLAADAIAKLRNQLARRPAGTLGVLFSRSGFTEAAHTLARYLAPQTILLWDGVEVRHALTHRRMVEGLQHKYRFAVEEGFPDFDLLKVQWP